MKYIVLDPISNVDPNSMLDSYFAQPRKKYDKETILKAFHSQTIAKIFSDEDEALHYARSQSKNGIPPKTSGRIAPIIECDLELSNTYKPIQKSCLALEADPNVTKANMVNKSVTYFEVPVNQISENTFTRAFFDKENLPTVDLRHNRFTCAIL